MAKQKGGKKKKQNNIISAVQQVDMPKLPRVAEKKADPPKKGPAKTPPTKGSRSQQKKEQQRKAAKARKPNSWINMLAVNHRDDQMSRIVTNQKYQRLLEFYSIHVPRVDPEYLDPGPWAMQEWLKRCADYFRNKQEDIPADLRNIRHDFIMILLFGSNDRKKWS